MKKIPYLLLASITVATAANAATLVEVDFAGDYPTGGLIASNDSQFTVVNSAVTFNDDTESLHLVGGTTSTSAWSYVDNNNTADGDLTSALSTDLYTASSFGTPTRFDLDLGFAAAGQSYTITSVEIDVTAADAATYNWDFMYRSPDSLTTNIISGGAIASQTAAGGTTTYTITGLSLTATDSTTAWNTGGTGELRFGFYDTGSGIVGTDNLRIDAIRVVGVPEPSSYALLGGLVALSWVMVRRRK